MALPCNNLNLNLYRVFYTVAKTKSFSESSRVLHISQPAISKHIQNLEYELNTLLFYRNNRGIELTSEAKVLLDFVEKAYNFLMLGEKTLQESKELLQGKVSIGIAPFLSSYYLKDEIKEFRDKHPNIVIKMASHDKKELLNLISQHTLDLLIFPNIEDSNKDFKEIPLITDEYCFILNPNYVNLKTNNLEDLVKENLLLPVKTTIERKDLEQFLDSKGIVVNPIMELETIEMMIDYVKEGLGIGYVPRKVAEQNKDLQIVDLKEKLPFLKIFLVYDEVSLTSSTKEFINLLLKSN